MSDCDISCQCKKKCNKGDMNCIKNCFNISPPPIPSPPSDPYPSDVLAKEMLESINSSKIPMPGRQFYKPYRFSKRKRSKRSKRKRSKRSKRSKRKRKYL